MMIYRIFEFVDDERIVNTGCDDDNNRATRSTFDAIGGKRLIRNNGVEVNGIGENECLALCMHWHHQQHNLTSHRYVCIG